MMNQYCVYILRSEKLNRFYIGSSGNFDVRKTFHNSAESRKFTAKADDWVLYLKIECESKHQALDIEKHIKQMKSSKYINNLLVYPEIIQKLKNKYC